MTTTIAIVHNNNDSLPSTNIIHSLPSMTTYTACHPSILWAGETYGGREPSVRLGPDAKEGRNLEAFGEVLDQTVEVLVDAPGSRLSLGGLNHINESTEYQLRLLQNFQYFSRLSLGSLNLSKSHGD